jgi:hypothetical protein
MAKPILDDQLWALIEPHLLALNVGLFGFPKAISWLTSSDVGVFVTSVVRIFLNHSLTSVACSSVTNSSSAHSVASS